MKYILLVLPFLLFGCKKPNTETKRVIEEPKAATKLPNGAVKGDFSGTKDTLYAYVKSVDTANETTIIGFEKEILPEISIPESIGAELKLLKLKNFRNDVLLVNAKLKDTNFNEYYLFVYKDSLWKQPVNRFDIHKSNMSDSLVPLKNNPKDSTQLLRYYSVFDMDKKSEKNTVGN